MKQSSFLDVWRMLEEAVDKRVGVERTNDKGTGTQRTNAVAQSIPVDKLDASNDK